MLIGLGGFLLACSPSANEATVSGTATVESIPTPTAQTPQIQDDGSASPMQVRDLACRGSERWNGIDVIVFLDPSITTDDINRLTDQVVSWEGVQTVRLVSQDEALAEFRVMFDEPNVSAAELPPSLRISARARQESILTIAAKALALDPMVYTVVSATDPCSGSCIEETGTRWEHGIDFIVFLNPDVSADDAARITAQVESWEATESVSFVNQEEAFAEFMVMFEGTETLDNVTVADMPPSLRIDMGPGQATDFVEVADSFRDGPSVFEVVIPAGVCGR